MNILFNISNHPSNTWDDNQKKGWDDIIDIPFPNIDPRLSWGQVSAIASNLIADNLGLVLAFHSGDTDMPEDSSFYFMVQGDFTLCYALVPKIRRFGKLALPTSDRLVSVNPDGSKNVKFRFVAWRIDGVTKLDAPKGVIVNADDLPLWRVV